MPERIGRSGVCAAGAWFPFRTIPPDSLLSLDASVSRHDCSYADFGCSCSVLAKRCLRRAAVVRLGDLRFPYQGYIRLFAQELQHLIGCI